MSYLRRFFLTALLLSAISACSTLRSASSGAPTLQTFDSIQINSTQLGDLKHLGVPTRKHDDSDAQILSFCGDSPCTRGTLTLRLNKSATTVQVASWVPSSHDTESKLDGALKHFSNLDFKKQRLLYDYGHYFHNTERYTHSQSGIVIIYDPDKKIVTHIYKAAPNSISPIISSTHGTPTISVLPDRDTASAR
jgi:hypothetical protein